MRIFRVLLLYEHTHERDFQICISVPLTFNPGKELMGQSREIKQKWKGLKKR